VLMAAGGVITWGGVPVYKTVKYLALDAELHRKRTGATAFCAAVALAVILLIGVIPFHVYVQAVGFLEPDQHSMLIAPYDGFVRQIVAHDGQWLHKGDVILVAQNDQLNAEIKRYKAQLLQAHAEMREADAQQDMVSYQKAQSDETSINNVLALDMKYKDSLTIRAPFDGQLVFPDLDQLQDSFVANGKTQLGMVATMNDLRVKAVFDTNDAELPWQRTDLDKVENQVRFVGDMGTVLHARTVKLFPGAVNEVNPALGPSGGGDLEMDPKDSKGTHPKIKPFMVELTVDNPNNRYFAGQRAYVRFTMERRPLMWQWMRRFWQIIQVHDSGKWL
jgi:putative peptide zinc metalloprotease protein